MRTHATAALAKLMRLSWEIQRAKHKTRAKSLTAAWAIFQNADIMVYHLVQRHTKRGANSTRVAANLSLFTA